jgi:hypothetical protein
MKAYKPIIIQVTFLHKNSNKNKIKYRFYFI